MNLLIFASFLLIQLFINSKCLQEFNISTKNKFESQIRFKRQINPKNGNGASKRMDQIHRELGRKGILRQDQIRYNRIEIDDFGERRHVSGLIVKLRNPLNPRKKDPSKKVRIDERWNEIYPIPRKRRVSFDSSPPTVHQLPPPPHVSFASMPTIHEFPRHIVSFNPEPTQIIPVPSRNQNLQMELQRVQPPLIGRAMRIGRNVLHQMDRGIQRIHRAFGNPAWPRRYAERNQQRSQRNRLARRGRGRGKK